MVERHQRRRLAAAAAVVLAGLFLTACGDGGADPDAGTTPSADEELAGKVPSDVAADGKILIGTNAEYAPNEFQDENGEIIGMDVDLGNAIAAKLGLQARFVNSPFDAIVAGVRTGKFELGMSSLPDDANREREVDMVTYFTAGTALGVARGNPLALTADTLCGRKVAVQRETAQVLLLMDRSAKCQAERKPPIAIDQFELLSQVNLAVTSGRDQAMLADSPLVDYAEQLTNGEIEKSGESSENTPYGIAVAKGKGQFAQALQAAVQALMADGTYSRILEKWNLQDGAIPAPQINPAGG